MKNFDWTQFTRKIAIETSMQNLYDAWTKPAELERWFLRDAAFFDETNTEISKTQPIQKGYRYEWQWHLYKDIEKGKILEANGRDRLRFTFAGDCKVEIFLEPFESYVTVSLTQSNIPTSDEYKINVRLGCDQGWSFYLVNLKSVYEGGLDLRNKNKELSPMLNN